MPTWIQHQTIDCEASVEVDVVAWEGGAVIICPTCMDAIPTYVEFTNSATASKTSAHQAYLDAIALKQQQKVAYDQQVEENVENGVKLPQPKTMFEILKIQDMPPIPDEGP